ncbi:uncharacterized protein YjbI with pentapeptide repeats [Flavobacterium sp. 2755]|uniref:DUF7619 domain-containing protein n=1 Tax=Flavobacterium sp. 2755 TaxID=2817765 RepID=UPI002856D2F7|nr:T9SS type A sorting domain-containing protein [Flavobacterium sp. 2755]MDR6763543.1 uncharacterized protein YjbI with pentapeptide repeats [Flavobacterium sp. 2755]
MKKNYFLLFSFFILFKVNSQIIDFKSPGFKTVLLLANYDNNIAKDSQGKSIKIDENDDTEIQLSEAIKVFELDMASRYIEDISEIENFTNLKKLVCSSNYLKTINISALKELVYLDCSGNLITALDASQLKNLETLVCAQGFLTSINLTGLSKLHHLHLSRNSLEYVDLSGLINLTNIDFGYNNLKALDLTGLTKLEDLICNDSKIESVNLTNCSELTRLWIQNNELYSLDLSSCPKLFELWADNNNLETIDLTAPKNIGNASLGNNKLTSVHVEDYNNIDFIRLSDNNFTTIDLSKFIKLSNVECKNNKPLTWLYLKNGKDEVIDIEGCLNLKYICNDEIKDSNVEKYLKYYNLTNVNQNSYCSFGPGGNYSVIKGQVKIDADTNGCDEYDSVFPNIKFDVTDGNIKSNIMTNELGNYNLLVGDGSYTIKPIIENPSYYAISPESVSVTFPADSNPFTQNFCITPNGSHQDLEIGILPINPARPGFDATYKIIYKNKGSQIKSGSVSLDFNDAVLDLVTSVPAITSQNTNKLVWNYIDLQPFESREILITLNVNSPMEIPAVNIDDRLSFTAVITPIIDDEKPVDNSFALRQTVVGSFDPNDKTCLEGDVIKPELIGEYVHYLIRFENTGTYPAENIVVKDLIDLSKFDISTLVPTGASHSYITKISNGNKVEFIFEKINLPFDDAHNDGYIAFKIKTLPTLKVGDSFTNEANIYFDYNFPILTNKATSTFKTLGTQDFEFSDYFNIYPNPVKDVLNIFVNNTIELKTINIYDILGQLIITVPNAEKTSNIDVSRLQAGNYILQVKTNKGNSSSKFIKY